MDGADTPSHALELQGVSRHFGSLCAIDKVSLSVPAGQRHAVLGSNGAGKTTLFNVITGEIAPSAGCIRLFGDDVTALAPHERVRSGLRRTYQTSQLFRELSVRDNLFLAAQGVRPGRLGLCRPRAGETAWSEVDELIERGHPQSIADAPVATLSHGQQRQLEITMALAGSPRLLLFDEPAAGLSPVERGDLIALLGGLPRHIGFVLIEHDLDVALSVVERVTVMHNGAVLVTGTPDEIQADERVHAIYMGEGRHARH